MRWLVLFTLAGCGRIAFDAPVALGDGGSDAHDAALGTWSAIQPLPGANDLVETEEDIDLSSDALEAYFTLGPDEGPKKLRRMTRASITSAWSDPADADEIDTSNWTACPRLAPDDLTIYFNSDRSGSRLTMWSATRATTSSAWGNFAEVTDVSDPMHDDFWLTTCAQGRYVLARETDSFKLFDGQLGVSGPTLIDLNTPVASRSGPFLSADCLTLYYSSDEVGEGDLFVTHRAAVTAPWDPPTPLAEFNDPDFDDADPWMSPDGRLFMFSSTRDGSPSVFFATR